MAPAAADDDDSDDSSSDDDSDVDSDDDSDDDSANKNWLPSSALVTTADWKPDTLRVALATVSCESYSKRCRNRCGVESVERGELKRRSRCVRGSPCGLSLRSESAVAGSTVRER